jgi:hypothetical protein
MLTNAATPLVASYSSTCWRTRAMLIRPVETERGAVVMENEDNVVTQFEFFPKGKEKSRRSAYV